MPGVNAPVERASDDSDSDNAGGPPAHSSRRSEAIAPERRKTQRGAREPQAFDGNRHDPVEARRAPIEAVSSPSNQPIALSNPPSYSSVSESNDSPIVAGKFNDTGSGPQTPNVAFSPSPPVVLDDQKRSQNGGSNGVRKDDLFYLSPLAIKVGDRVFNVPRNKLEKESSVVRVLLDSDSTQSLGSSNQTPLVLEGMTADEFTTFLDVLSEEHDESMNWESWISVLKVSSILDYKEIWEQSVKYLDGSLLGPVTRVELSLKYGVEKWRRRGYEALLLDDQPLEPDEAERIGWKIALRIATLRDGKLLDSIRIQHKPFAGRRSWELCARSHLPSQMFPKRGPKRFRDDLYKCASDVFGNDGPDMEDDDGKSTQNEPPAKPRRDYNASYIVIKVHDNLFRVPRETLEDDSSSFSQIHHLPKKGKETDEPLVLEDVSPDDFRSFLKCALRTFTADDKQEDWLAALRVADMWGFKRVREEAIAKLNESKLDLITRAEFSRVHNIHEWLRPTMVKLALQKAVPTEEEAERIGWENTFKLFILREDIIPERERMLDRVMDKGEKHTDSDDGEEYYTCSLCKNDYVQYRFQSIDRTKEARIAKKLVAKEFFSGVEDDSKSNARGSQPRPRSPPSASIRSRSPVRRPQRYPDSDSSCCDSFC